MASYRRVARVDEVPPGTGKVVHVDGAAVALFNVGGRFHALDNTCPHQGGPLGEGFIAGCVVTCPWHFWQFDVTTGAAAEFPEMRIERYAVRIEDDEIHVSSEPLNQP